MNQSQLEATVNAAVRANVAFYPIDARGLLASVPGGDATKSRCRGQRPVTAAKRSAACGTASKIRRRLSTRLQPIPEARLCSIATI